MFDDLVLLVQGQVVYWGPSKKCIRYFGNCGFDCPDFANPADFLFMDVIRTVDIEGMDAEQSAQTRLDTHFSKWKDSSNYVRIVARATTLDSTKYPQLVPLITKTSFARQFTYLYWDYLITGLRSPVSIPLRIVFSVYTGVILGITYAMLRGDGFQDQIRGKTGAISFLMTFSFIGGYFGCIQAMWNNRNVFMREYRSHYYDVTPAYLAKVCFSIPIDLVCGMLIALICYYIVGLNSAFSAYLFVATVAGISQTIGVLAGFTMGYSVADARKLVASAVISLLPFMIFGGLLIAPPNIPGYLRWLVYLNPIYYAFTAGMQVGFTPCPDAQSATESNPVTPCQRTVAFELYGIDEALPAGVNVILLITLGIVVLLTGWISLYLNAKYRSK